MMSPARAVPASRSVVAALGEAAPPVAPEPAAAPPVDAAGVGESPASSAVGEVRVRFPCLAVEGVRTADGRELTPGSITARAVPLTLLAQTRHAHGGQDAPAAYVAGRIDRLERVEGPTVISQTTGEPFPPGSFVWRGEGVIAGDAVDGEGRSIADLVRDRYLRFVSVDLLPQDYELYGVEEFEPNPDDPMLRARVTRGELAGATAVPVSAFGECYLEVIDDPAGQTDTTAAAPAVEPPVMSADLALAASAMPPVPAWRAAEVGDVMPALTAAGEQHTGGMVALVPDQVSIDALAIEGGEAPDELHLTLAYLGDDVTGWDAAARDQVIEAAEVAAVALNGPMDGRVFAHATFNPDAHADRDPCAVYLIGDTPDLTGVRGEVIGRLQVSDVPGGLPQQHEPYVPHLTAGYGLTAADLSFTGDVTFDRVRVALGGDVHDIPLTAAASPAEETNPMTAAVVDPDAEIGLPVRLPLDAQEQLVGVIDTGEQRDAPALAEAILTLIAQKWAATKPISADELAASGALRATLTAATGEGDEAGGLYPEDPQPCVRGDHPATVSLLYRPDPDNDGEPTAYAAVCEKHRGEVEAELVSLDPPEEIVGEVAITTPDSVTDVDPDSSVDATGEAVTAAALTQADRDKAADNGHALPDGSFPIANGDDLDNAIHAVGRTTDPEAARRHVMKRASELGLTNRVPEHWLVDGSTSEQSVTAAVDGAVPVETGVPDAPQPCLVDDDEPEHPATVSLLFDADRMFLASCAGHRGEAEEEIVGEGYEVSGEVPISQGGVMADLAPAAAENAVVAAGSM